MEKSRGVDILIAFDVTGSCACILQQVKKNVSNLLDFLFDRFPQLRIAIIAFSDYGDPEDVIFQQQDFTNDKNLLINFIKSARSGSGGDHEELYEVVLQKAQSLTWEPKNMKTFCLIGDSIPHNAAKYVKLKKPFINWEEELSKLQAMNVNIYAIQALFNKNYESKEFKFYQALAQKTNGVHLQLEQFSQIVEILEMVCLNVADENEGSQHLNQYNKEKSFKNHGMVNAFKALRRLEVDVVVQPQEVDEVIIPPELLAELKPCPPAKYQLMDVLDNCSVKDFVEANNIKFQLGFAFYEFNKPEIIADDKLIILRNKVTGETFEGEATRQIMNIKAGLKSKQKPTDNPIFKAFIQSTSVNRKLIEHTQFLYLSEDYRGEFHIPNITYAGEPEKINPITKQQANSNLEMLSLIYKAIEAYNVPEFQIANAQLAESIASLERALK